MIGVKAIFERKPSGFRTRDCAIVAVEVLPHEQFVEFCGTPLWDWEIIEKHKEKMFEDNTGITYALAVLDGGSNDGVLVDSEGSSYARYAAWLPDVKLNIHSEMMRLADKLVMISSSETTSGSYSMSFAEIEKRWGIPVSQTNGLGTILKNILYNSDEVSEVAMTEDGFDMVMHLDFCASFTGESQKNIDSGKPTLSMLLPFNLTDLHLVHGDEDIEMDAIVKLNDRTMTPAGQEAWADVLAAKVERIFNGYFGLQVELSDVEPQRLTDFSQALAGYCPVAEYEKWFASGKQEQGMEITNG